jgi:hypothetical protein
MPHCDFFCGFGRLAGLCIVLWSLLASVSQASDWQTVENTSDGIQVLKKEISDSSLVAFRGVGVVDAPLPLVATLIFDTARGTKWIKGLDESRILRWIDEDEFVKYDHIGLPFFLSDRDFVTKIKMSFDLRKKELIFHYRQTDDPSAPHTSYIRGEMIETTTITLRSIEDDKKTWVDAAFLCDPKGQLPTWLVNFFQQDWPKSTFRNLRKEALKPDLLVDPRFSQLLIQGNIIQ